MRKITERERKKLDAVDIYYAIYTWKKREIE
jgi:hypothetical protein